MNKLFKIVSVLLVVGLVGAVGAANATEYNITTINLTAYANNYFVSGINNDGDVVGFYGPSTNYAGFLWKNNAFTSISDSNYTSTSIFGINDAGKMAGTYSNTGFTYQNGTFTPVTPFPSPPPYVDAGGINNSGQIVGSYANASGPYNGYLLSGTEVTTLTGPEATGDTYAFGINDLGQVVGSFQGADNNWFGYKYADGIYSTFSVTQAIPGEFYAVLGINNSGVIVGNYSGSDNNMHGFIYVDGISTTLDFPGARYTWATGINDLGQIVGTYELNNVNYGFIATPVPVPGTLLLLGSGLAGLVVWRKRRQAAAKG